MPDKVPDGQMDVPTLHIVSYFACKDVFMSLHKPIVTLFLTPKKHFYEFTKFTGQTDNRMDGWTDEPSSDYMLPPLGRKIKLSNSISNLTQLFEASPL